MISDTNQAVLIYSFLFEKIINIIGNVLVHITNRYRFLISIALHATAILINIIITAIVFIRFLNVLTLCSIFRRHFNRKIYISKDVMDQSIKNCNYQIILYVMFILINFGTIILKSISINFSKRSHDLVMKLTKRKKKKKLN